MKINLNCTWVGEEFDFRTTTITKHKLFPSSGELTQAFKLSIYYCLKQNGLSKGNSHKIHDFGDLSESLSLKMLVILSQAKWALAGES